MGRSPHGPLTTPIHIRRLRVDELSVLLPALVGGSFNGLLGQNGNVGPCVKVDNNRRTSARDFAWREAYQMVSKTMLCLANSKKHSGRCIAGRELTSVGAGPWIRPVSARPGEEVSETERQYENGQDPQVLDIISVPLIQAAPHACQTENWLLDPDKYWRKIDRVGWTKLLTFVETPASLWPNVLSTYHGSNDELPSAIGDALPNSLCLINVPEVRLSVFAPSEAYGNPKRRVQGKFRYRGSQYALWVTDPIIESEYKAKNNGEYQLAECCLTISIGEPFTKTGKEGQYRYKLVAAVIQRSQLE